MEWRIVVPVLCLIGIITVPGISANSAINATTNSTVFEFNIEFHINDTFNETYFNMTNNATLLLKQKLISEVTGAYSTVKNFQRFDILQFRNGSIVVDGKLHFNSSDSKPIVANLTEILHATNFSFTIIKNLTRITDVTTTAAPATTAHQTTNSNQTTTTPAATVSTPAKLATVNVVFKINQEYKENYSNLSDPETIKLTDNITNAFTPFYKKRFANFLRMKIRKFSRGSIVADSVFEFDNTNNTSPNVKEATNAFTEAVASGNLSFTVDTNSINATDITNASTTAPATTAHQTANSNETANANQTTTTAAATVSTPAKLATVNVVFKINQEYKENYSNLSDPETVKLTDNITNAFTPFYKKRFANFLRMKIRKFSRGSIVADSVFEFDNTNNTSPNVTEVTNAFTEAVATGNFSFSVDTNSINATDITNVSTTTQAATTVSTTVSTTTGSPLVEYFATFRINEIFNDNLTNISSPQAVALAKKISDEFDGVFKKSFSKFVRTYIWRFRSGSVIVDALLGFNNTSTNPSAAEVVKVIKNGAFTFTVQSANVTDSSGITANRSPVLASMLTALWMTLTSLLVSAVLH